MKLKCIVSYDGADYQGYQRQPDGKTVQGTIEKAIDAVTHENNIIYASGRTDRGVHARGQVFHFETNINMPIENWVRAINDQLPNDIYIKTVDVETEDFHARYSLKKKEYRYYINIGDYSPFYDRFSAHYKNLDVEKMKKAILLFEGTHDFLGFAGDVGEKNTVKTIYKTDLKLTNNIIEMSFIGNGFLKYMVRIMVGTIVEIGLGKKDMNVINEIFETKNRLLAGKTIAAKGLFLYEVIY